MGFLSLLAKVKIRFLKSPSWISESAIMATKYSGNGKSTCSAQILGFKKDMKVDNTLGVQMRGYPLKNAIWPYQEFPCLLIF